MTKRPTIETKLDESLFELKVILTAEHKRDFSEFPMEFFGEARLRMAALKAQGDIEVFTLYEDQFGELWRRFVRKGSLDYLEVVIASGRPPLPGVEVETNADSYVPAHLSFLGNRHVMGGWHPQWLLLLVDDELKKAGIEERIDTAQLYGYWAKFVFNGEPVLRAPLHRFENKNPLPKGEEFTIRANQGRTQVDVLFGTFRPFYQPDRRDDLRESVELALNGLAESPETGGYWRATPFLLEGTIAQCRAGQQSLGLGLPVVGLGGICMTSSPFADDAMAGLPDGSAHLYSPVLLAMLRLDGARYSADWLSERLSFPVPLDSIRGLMAIVEARGLVEIGDDPGDFSFPKDIHAVGFWRTACRPNGFHRAAIRSALSAYQMLPADRLYSHGASFAINERDLGTINELLYDFLVRVRSIVEEEPRRDQLWQLNAHFFPLTRATPDYRLIGTDRHKLEAESFEGAWLKPFLLEMSRMEVFRAEGSWLAGKSLLPCTISQCVQALEQMREAGELVYAQDRGRLVQGISGYGPIELLDAVEHCVGVEQEGRFQLGTAMLPVGEMGLHHIFDEGNLLADQVQKIAANSRGADQLFRLNLMIFPQTI